VVYDLRGEYILFAAHILLRRLIIFKRLWKTSYQYHDIKKQKKKLYLSKILNIDFYGLRNY